MAQPAYFILTRKVTDPEVAQQYLDGAAEVTRSYGGTYLVRGAVPTVLEGAPVGDGYATVIVRFPSAERALEFYHSEEYRPWHELAQRAFDRQMIMVEGLPDAD